MKKSSRIWFLKERMKKLELEFDIVPVMTEKTIKEKIKLK